MLPYGVQVAPLPQATREPRPGSATSSQAIAIGIELTEYESHTCPTVTLSQLPQHSTLMAPCAAYKVLLLEIRSNVPIANCFLDISFMVTLRKPHLIKEIFIPYSRRQIRIWPTSRRCAGNPLSPNFLLYALKNLQSIVINSQKCCELITCIGKSILLAGIHTYRVQPVETFIIWLTKKESSRSE